MATRRPRDAGQAFPIYIVVVAGLLFLAFAYFAVGQAAATRNGAQTAADSAALAAGQEYRKQLTEAFIEAIRDGSAWEDLLEGRGVGTGRSCAEAQWFAGRNEADVTDCAADSWPTSFAVRVKTRGTVGNSVIPGTESKHAEAKAKSVVEPRCTVEPTDPAEGDGSDTSSPPEPPGATDPPGATEPPGASEPSRPPIELDCDGKGLSLDPEDLGDPPDASDLFSVRLAD